MVHKCLPLNKVSEIVVNKKWRENVRKCKRNLVCFLGQYFLHHSSNHLSGNQTMYIAGAFSNEIVDTA